jgi:hypothetical protein
LNLFFSNVFFYLVLSDIDMGCVGVQDVAGQLEGARAWGSQGAALGQLDCPFGVVAMLAGGVWVADQYNHRMCLLH